MFTFLAVAVSLVLYPFSLAQLVPTAPGPGDSFKQGTPCTVSWTPDTSGKWKTTFIELMTGANNPMVHLTTVASVDGTDPKNTSISFTCPAVTPNSPIYFYQFTAQGQNTTWTARFTIASPSGATSPPPNANQPDGQPIPWGTGKLLDPSQGSPPPPTAPPGQIDGALGAAAPNATMNSTALSSSSASVPSTSLSVVSSSPIPLASSSPNVSTVVPVAASGPALSTPTPSASHNGAGASPRNTLMTLAAVAVFTLVALS